MKDALISRKNRSSLCSMALRSMAEKSMSSMRQWAEPFLPWVVGCEERDTCCCISCRTDISDLSGFKRQDTSSCIWLAREACQSTPTLQEANNSSNTLSQGFETTFELKAWIYALFAISSQCWRQARSRAAHSLYVAQPALTAQIKKLEAELGAQLLERTHAGVTATPAGTQLYEDARRLLSDADAMCERIQRLPMGPEGSVSIAMPFLLTGLLMGPVIASLRQSHPRIRVFVLDDSSLMVQKPCWSAGLTWAFWSIPPACKICRYSLWPPSPFISAAMTHRARSPPALPRQYEGKTPCLDFSHAAAQPLVLQSRRFSIRQTVEQAASDLQLSLNIVHEHDSARVIRSLYQCGAGFTFTPSCSLAESLQPQAVHSQWIVARVCQPDLQRHYHLARQPGRSQDAAVNVVQHALLEHAQTLIDQGHWQAQWLYQAP